MQTSLNYLEEGQWGKVIDLTCKRTTARRLFELGVTPNTHLYCVRWAPMHGAIEVKIRGYLLALGYSDAASILIEKEGE